MRTPNAEHAEVPERKATEYLLSFASEAGHGKAAHFISRGFAAEEWRGLAQALCSHVQDHDYVEVEQTNWGTKYVVDGPLQCPDGRTAGIRSVWNIKPPATHPRLVTAYPLAQRRN